MFLPLTKNGTFWDKSQRLLFIEDIFWMNQEPKYLQGLSYEILDVDYSELDINEEELHIFVVQLAEASGEILNKYHNVSFSHTYWKSVLFIWMRHFVPAVYLRFLRLLSLQEKFSEEEIETTVLDAWKYTLLNAEELETLNGDDADLYGWHLYSLILKYEKFDIDKKNIVFNGSFPSKYESKLQNDTRSSRLKNYATRILRKLRKPCELAELGRLYAESKFLPERKLEDVEVVLSSFGHRSLLLKLEIKSRGKIIGFPSAEPVWIQHVTTVPEIQLEFRQQAAEMLKLRVKADVPWKRVLRQVFFEEMPCSYIENFEMCRSVYQWQYEKYPRLKYIIGYAGALFTESKMAMAEQREQGRVFSFVAHGGSRQSKNFRFWFGRVFSDVYYSWEMCEGVVEKNIINYRRVPAEKLYMYDNMTKYDSSYILYVGDWVSPVLHRPGYHTMGRVLQREIKFLERLGEKVRKDILIRNYPTSASALLDRWIRYSFPTIRLSRENETASFKNETFAEILLSSRLCVLDHYETPFAEALYINKPFILYFDESFSSNYFDPDTEQSYVDMMRSVGIIQYGPEAAAKYLNEIYPRIEDWWAEPERQRVVEVVKERYIGSYTDPEEWWYKEIMGLLRGDVTW